MLANMHITSLFTLFALVVSFVAAAPINDVMYRNYPPLLYLTLDSRLANMRAIARGPKNETHGGVVIIKSWKKLGTKITLSTKLYLQLG